MIIKDPKLEPFHIIKDKYCYTIMEEVTPNEKYVEKGKPIKNYTKTLSHHSTLGGALVKIAKGRLDLPQNEYYSVKEYIDRHEALLNEMKKLKEELGV